MLLFRWWALPSFAGLRQSLVTFIHGLYVHLAEKPVSEETEHLCLARMDLPLSLPDSPVVWWVHFIHSWVPLGFCSFPDYPEWLQASFNSPLSCPGHVEIWNTEDPNIPAPRSAPITVTCYYGILFSENTLTQKKKKIRILFISVDSFYNEPLVC